MATPKFVDFSKIPSILVGDVELFHLPTAISITGVMSGKSPNSYTYHVGKVMSTFEPFATFSVPRMCKGTIPVKAHNQVGDDPNAPSGQYVEKKLVYKLLFMSNLTENRMLAEHIMTTVTWAICEQGFYACDAVNPTQN
jgi:hypothetical protein